MKFTIDTKDKPHLAKAMKTEPALAKEVIETFVQLMDEAFDPEKGIRWVDLPKEFHKDMTFRDVVRGILRGALDVRQMNPDAFDVIKAEVHPLSMLMPRKNVLDGTTRAYNWRSHFQLPDDALPTEDTVAKIIRKLLRYGKYVSIQHLQEALEYNQVATYRGLGEEQVKKLPFYPALRYQQETFGELHVGKFFGDVGLLDCGEYVGEVCPACQRQDIVQIDESYYGCMSCNAGYIKEGMKDA